jgi:hypothetical protein
MSRIWSIIKSYLFWTYERGSFHYDVMVTVILLFIFVAPRFINFKDQPAGQHAHPNEIVVTADGNKGYIYQADASAVDAQDDAMVRANFARLLQPMLGNVTIARVEPVRDTVGRIVAYRAWIKHRD